MFLFHLLTPVTSGRSHKSCSHRLSPLPLWDLSFCLAPVKTRVPVFNLTVPIGFQVYLTQLPAVLADTRSSGIILLTTILSWISLLAKPPENMVFHWPQCYSMTKSWPKTKERILSWFTLVNYEFIEVMYRLMGDSKATIPPESALASHGQLLKYPSEAWTSQKKLLDQRFPKQLIVYL